MKSTALIPSGAVLKVFENTMTKGTLMKACENGIIQPYHDPKGTGNQRHFDIYNLIEIGIWRELYFLKVQSGLIKEILDEVRQIPHSQ